MFKAVVAALIAVCIPWWISKTSLPVMCPEKDLADQVVLITGASSGVGRGLALLAAQRGASLLLVARREQELFDTKRACERVQRANQKVRVVVGDVLEENVSNEIRETIRTEFQSQLNIAILVHALIPSLLLSESQDWAKDLRSTLDVNLLSIVKLSQELLPFLQATPDSSLVTLGSAGQFIPQAFLSFYLIPKTALQAFFDHLRIEQQHHRRLGTSLKVGEKSSLTISFIVLGEVHTEQLEEKYSGADLKSGSGLVLSVEESARQIMCAVDRKLQNTYVPYTVGWLAFLLHNDIGRDYLWGPITKHVWIQGKHDYEERWLATSRE